MGVLTIVLDVLGLLLLLVAVVGLALTFWPASALLGGVLAIAVSWWLQR